MSRATSRATPANAAVPDDRNALPSDVQELPMVNELIVMVSREDDRPLVHLFLRYGYEWFHL